MKQYIPTTERVRATFMLANCKCLQGDEGLCEGRAQFDAWLEQHNKTKEREVLERTATAIEQFGKSWVGAEGFGLILESGKMSELFARIIREMK